MRVSINSTRREAGQAIVLLAIVIFALIAIAGLAVDGGMLYAERRFDQNSADNAALSGALAICNSEDVEAAVENSVEVNSNGQLLDVTVNQPPLSGPNTGDNTYVEVLVHSSKQPVFAQIVYSGTFESTARAVGQCFTSGGPIGGGNVVLVLNEDGNCSFSATGNATLNLTLGNGGIYANSNDSNAAICASGNASVNTDTGVFVVGGYSENGGAAFSPPPVTGVSPIPDPLAALVAPPDPGGTCITYSLGSSDIATIDPGKYCSITLTSSAELTMNPGIYFIEGGNFSASASADVYGNEVMIYMDEGNFSLVGNGTFDISAPSSGPYQGLMLFMDQSNVSSITIQGNGVVQTQGTIYGALAHMALEGNGTSTVLNAQIIVDTLAISGNATMTLNYDPNLVFGGPDGPSFIELSE